MSGAQVFMLACFLLAAAIFLLAAVVPPYLASIRRWYDTVDALEESHPELAKDWYEHMPLRVRPWRRWAEGK